MPSYTSIHLAARPQASIIAGETFTPKQHSVPSASSLKDGEVLFQTLYLSLDPAMRGWLNPTRSYIPPVEIGAVMRGSGIGLIVASKSSKFLVGTYATAMCGWSEYAVLREKFVEKLDLPEGAVPTDALGVLGMTGLTAYFGLLEIGQVKKGDFVVVSGAAGATGSVVGQIAKLKGAKVLGLAGEDSKVQWLKEDLGFDEALNYKDKDFITNFRAATKGLIDVYFDNGKFRRTSLEKMLANLMLQLVERFSIWHCLGQSHLLVLYSAEPSASTTRRSHKASRYDVYPLTIWTEIDPYRTI
jgi:NADPH-dependent curcumin reductase CurA